MKIGLAPIGTTTVSVWLITGADPSSDDSVGPAEETFTSTVDVQPRKRFRAADNKPADRGNRQRTRTFKGEREFATINQAHAFMHAHEAALDGDWDALYYDEADTLVATMTDTVVAPVVMTRLGCVVFCTYTLIGGAVTVAP